MNLMVESAIRQSKLVPSFAGSAAHEVRLTLEGSVQNPAFVRFLEHVGEDRLRHFSTYDFLTLDAICRDQPLTEPMRTRLPGLLEAGAIEVQGRGRGMRHHLSRALYATIGQKGVYTRRKGLDHETNKALLMKHLAENEEAGAPMAELLQVLPALSRAHVKRLLWELAGEGRARMSGVTKSARWFAASGNSIGSFPANEPMSRSNEPKPDTK